jgi:hypothetical protein
VTVPSGGPAAAQISCVTPRASVSAASSVSTLPTGRYACISSCNGSAEVHSRCPVSSRACSKKRRAGSRSGRARPTAYMNTLVSTKIMRPGDGSGGAGPSPPRALNHLEVLRPVGLRSLLASIAGFKECAKRGSVARTRRRASGGQALERCFAQPSTQRHALLLGGLLKTHLLLLGEKDLNPSTHVYEHYTCTCRHNKNALTAQRLRRASNPSRPTAGLSSFLQQ